MLKTAGLKVLQVSMAVLTFLAFANAVSACMVTGYQPAIPEELADE
jgi:cyclic lactone autoinducer peptide